MSVPARLVAFGIGLLVVFALGLTLGATFGPDPARPSPSPAPSAVEMEH